MSFEINFELSETIPGLAWAALYEADNNCVNVVHGSMVETAKLGLVEGAWDGDFPSFNFHKTAVFSGTGFCTHDNKLLFCSSTDQICPIFSLKVGSKIHISNSPVFLMVKTGTSPIPSYPYYHFNFVRTSRQGLHCLSGTMPLDEGQKMQIHLSAILVIDETGKISFEKHHPGECPENFDHLHSILTESVTSVLENAQHSSRKHPMESIAAISTGYDSTACAALAKEAGCTRTNTFYDSKEDDPHQDSGAQNAHSLGMQCTEYDRWDYLKSDKLPEAEFGFSVFANNVTFAAMEKELAGKIYIIGSGGDDLWSPKRLSVMDQLARTWSRSPAATNQLEFRLRVGYCVFSPVYITARHTEALHRIITSEEMKPWSIGGKYDRPLPRRIAELAGIPRQQFGIIKRATGHSAIQKNKLFSKSAYKTYCDFRRAMVKQAGLTKTFFYYACYSIYFFVEYRLLKRKSRYKPSTYLQRKFPFISNNPPTKHRWESCFFFQWMFAELKDRYSKK